MNSEVTLNRTVIKEKTLAASGNSIQKASKVLVISSDLEIIHILEVNLVHASLEVLTARKGTKALNLIQNEYPDIILLDTALPDIGHFDMCRRIKGITSTDHIPIIVIGTRPRKNNKVTETGDNIIHIVTKPFEPREVVALVQGYLRHKERMINKDPLTGLPNRAQLSKEIGKLIDQKTAFAVMYINMHNLAAINKAYGYAQGDYVIRLLADIVSEAVHLFGNPDDLAGHLGGDKFLVTSSPWKARTLCRRIIADYNRRVKLLYSDAHIQTGYAALLNPRAAQEQTPNMSIHIAVVTNQKHVFHNSLEVIQIATEQIEYLKSTPESNCYFDLKDNESEMLVTSVTRVSVPVNKEEVKTAQGILAWFDFLTRELDSPISEVKSCLQSLESCSIESFNNEQLKYLISLKDNCRHLINIIEGVAGLVKVEEVKTDGYEEVDIQETLESVINHLKQMAEQRQIKIKLEIISNIGRIIRDKRSLVQGLLYIIRCEILASPPGTTLYIRLIEKNEEQINIKIFNPKHDIAVGNLNGLVQKRYEVLPEIRMDELNLARTLVRSIGGELEATNDTQKGITYLVTLPKKWRSWVQEIDTLRVAMEISRKEARDTLGNVRKTVVSLEDKMTPETRDSFDKLSDKVQELAVICNRSLYLADDYCNSLEFQQDRLIEQESEQYATSEAVLTICRGMMKSAGIKDLFDIDSAKRVINYSLAIAKELKISEADRKALYYASLYKDVTLAFSRGDVKIPGIQIIAEAPVSVKGYLNMVWKALSTIPFFTPACNILLYRWENFNGTGGSFGIKASDIPLGSRILAVADAYERLTSEKSPDDRMTPEAAMQTIGEHSGICFDPYVVNTFLTLWKRKEIDPALKENHGKEEKDNILT